MKASSSPRTSSTPARKHSAPLYIDGEFFGCICIDNVEDVNAFSKKDIEMIKYISVHLEMVIKNMLHMDTIKQHLITDSLTGLFNRRYYNNMIEYDSGSSHGNVTTIMIDMDNFKQINDTYGHFKGDEVLKYFSDLLRSRFRKSDTIIRFAGDEFLLVLDNCDEKDAVRILADIQKELRSNPYEGINIEFSYGTSIYGEGSKIEELVKTADSNMYMQKAAKKS
jgi:diguanylate cyclase (GGDEF)-like protein